MKILTKANDKLNIASHTQIKPKEKMVLSGRVTKSVIGNVCDPTKSKEENPPFVGKIWENNKNNKYTRTNPFNIIMLKDVKIVTDGEERDLNTLESFWLNKRLVARPVLDSNGEPTDKTTVMAYPTNGQNGDTIRPIPVFKIEGNVQVQIDLNGKEIAPDTKVLVELQTFQGSGNVGTGISRILIIDFNENTLIDPNNNVPTEGFSASFIESITGIKTETAEVRKEIPEQTEDQTVMQPNPVNIAPVTNTEDNSDPDTDSDSDPFGDIIGDDEDPFPFPGI